MTIPEKLLSALNEPIFELDTSGKVVFATPALHEWTGKSGSYAFASVLSAEYKKRFEQALARILEGKTLNTRVDLVLSRDRGAVPIELTLNAMQGEGGKVSGVACWLHDLTMVQALEAAANVQGTHLFDLVENTTHACVIESAHGTVEMVNTAFCDLFGLSAAAQSLVGTACTSLFDEAALQVEKRIGPIYFELDSAEPAELEFTLENGQTVVQRTRPVATDHGIAGRLHLFHSKTIAAGTNTAISASLHGELVLIEEVAQQIAATASAAQQAMDQAEQLELPEMIIQPFREVRDTAQAAFQGIAHLIDFSRMDSSRIEIHAVQFRLREAIAGMLDLLLPIAAQAQVELVLKVEQDVPDHLCGDGALLLHALKGLVLHGIDSVPRGRVLLSIAPEYSAGERMHLSFSVQCQKAAVDSQMAVEPLGMMHLAAAKNMIKSLNGKMEFKETIAGPEYQFTLEFTWQAATQLADRFPFITLSGMPVLIVSANKEERESLANLLRTWRMQPWEADHADMAMLLLGRMQREDNRIPLVIISEHLPGQTGFLLAFRIKHRAALKSTVVMMLAQKGKPGDAIACRENSISAYLRQPITAYHLHEAIAMLMGVVEADAATHTLITRHSLRESSAGNVLLIDGQHDQSIVAVNTLRKNDFRVVVAETAQEAYESLKQDIFDLILVHPATPGFARNKSIPGLLRNHIQKNAELIPILRAIESGSPGGADYSGQVSRPYDKELLISEVRLAYRPPEG